MGRHKLKRGQHTQARQTFLFISFFTDENLSRQADQGHREEVLQVQHLRFSLSNSKVSYFCQCCQCFGSGSAFNLSGWIRIRIPNGNTYPDLGGPKRSTKIEFWSDGCSHLRDKYFSCSLCILCSGLGKYKPKLFPIWYSPNFMDIKYRIWIRVQIWQKMLDPDPQHWMLHSISVVYAIVLDESESFYGFLIGMKCMHIALINFIFESVTRKCMRLALIYGSVTMKWKCFPSINVIDLEEAHSFHCHAPKYDMVRSVNNEMNSH